MVAYLQHTYEHQSDFKNAVLSYAVKNSGNKWENYFFKMKGDIGMA